METAGLTPQDEKRRFRMFRSEKEKNEKSQFQSAGPIQVRKEFARSEAVNFSTKKAESRDEKVVRLRPDLYEK